MNSLRRRVFLSEWGVVKVVRVIKRVAFVFESCSLQVPKEKGAQLREAKLASSCRPKREIEG
jgi:hypothetical protein